MILGIGHDIVKIERIRRLYNEHGSHFIKRVFTANEWLYASSKQDPVPTLAKRFAAKEACAKALGTGLGRGAFFVDIEVNRDRNGAPSLVLHRRALDTLSQITPPDSRPGLFLSLSDEDGLASAFVMIDG